MYLERGERTLAKKEIVYKTCSCCGEEKKSCSDNFYKSYSILYKSTHENRMNICKDCLLTIAHDLTVKLNSEVKALYHICQLTDTLYDENVYDSACEQAKKQNANVFKVYYQKVVSLPQHKNKTFLDSTVFSKAMSSNVPVDSGDTEEDIVDFWGEGFTDTEYRFLEKEFNKMAATYEMDSYSIESLFQEIALQKLDIRKKRKAGDSVDKELKTLQDLLGSANIKPVQENASVASEQVTMGTLIKKFENEKPIPEPLPEWKAADWIRKYIVVWFFGNLCRMMGKKNPYQEEYEEEMAKYTVNPYEDGE